MCINPNYCDGDCEECDLPRSYMNSLVGTDGKQLFPPPKRYYLDKTKSELIDKRLPKKVVSQEGRDKFIEGQFKIVSEMGRKFYRKYRGTESVNNEFKRQNRKNRKII